MSRKRRRSQAVLAEEERYEERTSDADTTGEEHDSEERRKELEIWDAFKEEHHEILEQLPLSLHRQYTLIRELDDQSNAYHADLLDNVRKYIALRIQLTSRRGVIVDAKHSNMIIPAVSDLETMQADSPRAAGSPPRNEQANSESLAKVLNNTHSANPTVSIVPSLELSSIELPSSGKTTRILLQQIAQVSEEVLRASEEKVNIAQTAYETVDRHIRLLDQAIKEQEASISLGIRPGTHLAPILLPDLVVPRWVRPTRIERSPTPSLSPELSSIILPQESTEELSTESARPGRGRKARKKLEPEPETPPPLPEEVLKIPATRTTRSVKLKIPAQAQADPNEPRYCYCNQVSYETMIACDNDACKLEWFHLPCTGLSAIPSSTKKWYCQNCLLKMTQKGKKR
jgi:inhibitor of growth protein 3/inhibitor of growth protein 4/inhibitor-of-growth protein 1